MRPEEFLENIFGCPQQQIEELQGFLNPGSLISEGSDATHQFTLADAMGVLGESEKSLQVVDNLIRRYGESTYIKTATQKLKKDMPYEYQRNPPLRLIAQEKESEEAPSLLLAILSRPKVISRSNSVFLKSLDRRAWLGSGKVKVQSWLNRRCVRGVV